MNREWTGVFMVGMSVWPSYGGRSGCSVTVCVWFKSTFFILLLQMAQDKAGPCDLHFISGYYLKHRQ